MESSIMFVIQYKTIIYVLCNMYTSLKMIIAMNVNDKTQYRAHAVC